MIKAAGFDGIGIEYGTQELGTDACPISSRMELFKDYQLGLLITAFPRTIDDLRLFPHAFFGLRYPILDASLKFRRPYLEMACEHDARFVNVIGQVMTVTVDG